MKLAPYLLALLIFPFCFMQACEEKKTVCPEDTLLRDARDSAKAWRNIVTLNHTHLEINQATIRDLASELDAEKEQRLKLRERLDSAASIIKRQNSQLANSIYNKPKE